MLVRDVMRKPISVHAEETLEVATLRLKEENVGALPVVEDDRVVGMITDRDILLRGFPEGRRYQIEFIEEANTIVHMMHVEAGSPATAFQLVVANGWPPGAIAARVFDNNGLARTFHLRTSGQV